MTKKKERLNEEIEEQTKNQEENQEQEIDEKNEEIHSDKDAVQEEMKDQKHGDDIEALKNQLQKKQQEATDYYDRWVRLQADFTNYKKRVEREKGEIYKYANEKLALDLLGIIDNLERALDSQKNTSENSGLYEGVELIFKQFKDALQKHGVEEIDAQNKPFDMNLHHAVMREEADVEADLVIEVLQKGYTIHGKVIRPAMVKVSQ